MQTGSPSLVTAVPGGQSLEVGETAALFMQEHIFERNCRTSYREEGWLLKVWSVGKMG